MPIPKKSYSRRSISRFCFVDNDIDVPHFNFYDSTALVSTSQADSVELPINILKPIHVLQQTVGLQHGVPLDLQRHSEILSLPTGREVREKAVLNGMLAPVRMETGWITTQPVNTTDIPGNSGSPTVVALGEPITDQTSTPSHLQQRRVREDEQIYGSKMVLKNSMVATLLARRGEEKQGQKKEKRPRTHAISCECGYREEDRGMICCDVCDRWQHAHCYGFTSEKDERIADSHYCYNCLLKSEGALLLEMKELALFRRALRFVYDTGKVPSTYEAFAAEIGKQPECMFL